MGHSLPLLILLAGVVVGVLLSVWTGGNVSRTDRVDDDVFVLVDESGSFDRLLQRAKPPRSDRQESGGGEGVFCAWGDPGQSRATLCKRCDVVRNFAAVGRWTPEYLAQRASDVLLSVKWLPVGGEREFVFQRAENSLPLAVDVEQAIEALPEVVAFRAGGATRTGMAARDFFARLRAPADKQYYWAGDVDVFAAAAALDLQPVNASLWLSVHDRNNPVWIGHEGVTVRRHFDYTHNVYVQLYGNKTFCLLGHDAAPELPTYPWFHPGYRQQVLGHDDHPLGDCVTLSAGDALYIPPFAWHHVRADSASISVSFFCKELQLVADHLLELPVPFDADWTDDRGTRAAALAHYLDRCWPGLRSFMLRTRYAPAFGRVDCRPQHRLDACPPPARPVDFDGHDFARGHRLVTDVLRRNSVSGAIANTLLATYFDTLIVYFVGPASANVWLQCCAV